MAVRPAPERLHCRAPVGSPSTVERLTAHFSLPCHNIVIEWRHLLPLPAMLILGYSVVRDSGNLESEEIWMGQDHLAREPDQRGERQA